MEGGELGRWEEECWLIGLGPRFFVQIVVGLDRISQMAGLFRGIYEYNFKAREKVGIFYL